jgi:hypothetical protein
MAAKSEQLQIRVTPDQKVALKRAAHRMGVDVSTYALSRLLPPIRTRAVEILASLRRGPDHRFALADLHDFLTGVTPAQFRDVADDLAPDGLSAFLSNYVAAMVEQAASQKSESTPQWTRHVVPLDQPYFAVPFVRLRPHLLRVSPVPFKRRNLFVDATLGDRV